MKRHLLKLKIKKVLDFLFHSLPTLINHPLWVERRFQPFFRFLKLQLIFALGEDQICLKWVDNLFLFIEKGDAGLTGNYYFGLHEFDDMAFAIHLLREDDIFLDIGANLGSYSLLASGLCKANTIAFEPVPATFSRLMDNIQINRLTNRIKARKIALSSTDAHVDNSKLLFSVDKGPCNSIVDEAYNGRKDYVEISTVDYQCINLDPKLMKIDVEGFEELVLNGSKLTISKETIIAIIIEGQSDNVNNILRSNGFLDFNYEPFSRKLSFHTELKNNRIWVKETRIEEARHLLSVSKERIIYGRHF